MTRTRARIGLAGIALALTVSLGACFPFPGGGGGVDPTPEPTETLVVEAELGVPIRVQQSEGVGELTITDPTWSTEEPGGLPVPPDKGGYLAVEATWTALEGSTDVLINFWAVIDASGTESDPYFFVEDVFAGENLTAGDTIQGDIVFDTGPGPYIFIVYDDFINEVARFSFEAPTREGLLWG